MNEVNLKKLSDGRDVIDDLFEICGKFNDVPNQQKQIGDVKKSNGEIILCNINILISFNLWIKINMVLYIQFLIYYLH